MTGGLVCRGMRNGRAHLRMYKLRPYQGGESLPLCDFGRFGFALDLPRQPRDRSSFMLIGFKTEMEISQSASPTLPYFTSTGFLVAVRCSGGHLSNREIMYAL